MESWRCWGRDCEWANHHHHHRRNREKDIIHINMIHGACKGNRHTRNFQNWGAEPRQLTSPCLLARVRACMRACSLSNQSGERGGARCAILHQTTSKIESHCPAIFNFLLPREFVLCPVTRRRPSRKVRLSLVALVLEEITKRTAPCHTPENGIRIHLILLGKLRDQLTTTCPDWQ